MNKLDSDPDDQKIDKHTSVKVGFAAIAGISIAVAAMSVIHSSSKTTDIKPDNTVEVKKAYKNFAIPMMSKDRKNYQISGRYEQDFKLEIISPENISEQVIVKVDPEGKYEAKGKFEKEATKVEFKAATLDGREIAFISYEEVQQYIKQNPEKPKPIVGASILHSMKGLKPDILKIIPKPSE